MPAVELYGANTGNCLRVAIALEEAGISYMPLPLDLKRGDQHAAGYLAVNSAGQVPTLVDRSGEGPPVVISQSNAILFHLACTSGTALLPLPGTPEHTVALERFFFFLTDIIGPSHGAFQLRRAGHQDGAACLDERLLATLPRAERFLTDTAFMSGSEFGLADIAAFTILLAYRHRVNWGDLSAMSRWHEAVGLRPAVIRGLQAFRHD